MSAGGPWAIERSSTDYPVCLTDLDPPEQPLLYGAGRRDAIAGLARDPVVTIVGARQASGYGLRVAERLGRDLAVAGVTVVSGMARGIDAAAHRGALLGGGATIAVLAGGPDNVYPPMNRALYREILGVGAVISEHPPGTEARKHQFPARNRIMAALGAVAVIVEAAQPSGSLITADLAAKLGRTVGAVPGQLGVRVAEGANDLIKEGAHLIRDARDVLDLLFGVGVEPGRPQLHAAPAPRAGPPLKAPLRAVVELVGGGAATVDRVALDGDLAPREAAVALARLERLGYVTADPFGRWGRTDLTPPDRAPGGRH
ncbi:MAG: dprA [Solirubrobacterales bacterium]|jgi:DNA processing protein|nr:dprA [Solirubrobacterales bacterium]